jgi:hypothetical protein
MDRSAGCVSWRAFAAAEPDLAAKGRHLLTQFGLGLGFLATVSAECRPRLHPITLGIDDRELFSFIGPGPKQRDLIRDGAFALHAFLPDEVEEEFVVSGFAELAPDDARGPALAGYYSKNVPEDHLLFWFRFDRALHAAYRYRGDWPPTYTRWRA